MFKKRKANFEVYKSTKSSEWYWRLIANNGRIIADSGEGYETRWGCIAAAMRVRDYAPKARIEVIQ